MALTNYEIMRNSMRSEFVKYDQKKMIEKFNLNHDENYIYIEFVKRNYRIGKNTGLVEWSDDGFQKQIEEADYNESMTIYDVLCYSKENCRLAGRFCPVNMLKGTIQSSSTSAKPGSGMFQSAADSFDGQVEKLQKALNILGVETDMKADAAAVLYPFSFLPITVQYWESDEEFPANLKFMVDENMQDFMHFETIWFMFGHILRRIKEVMGTVEYTE